MMYNMEEKILESILKKHFSALVGKSCKRIEVIRNQNDIHSVVKYNLIRDLIRELDYEAMRDIISCVKAFSEGTKIQVTLIKPER